MRGRCKREEKKIVLKKMCWRAGESSTGGSKEIVLLAGQSTFFERGKKKESGSGRFCLGPYRRVRGWWDDEVKFGGFGTTLFRKRFQKGLAISIGIGYNNLKVDYYLTIHDCST